MLLRLTTDLGNHLVVITLATSMIEVMPDSLILVEITPST